MCTGWVFWKLYIGQAVGGELDLIVLAGGAEEQAAIQWKKSMWLFFNSFHLLTYCLKKSEVIHAFLLATYSTGNFVTFFKHRGF
jgi:hypothetical protein